MDTRFPVYTTGYLSACERTTHNLTVLVLFFLSIFVAKQSNMYIKILYIYCISHATTNICQLYLQINISAQKTSLHVAIYFDNFTLTFTLNTFSCKIHLNIYMAPASQM